jgi:hypothetical protein
MGRKKSSKREQVRRMRRALNSTTEGPKQLGPGVHRRSYGCGMSRGQIERPKDQKN